MTFQTHSNPATADVVGSVADAVGSYDLQVLRQVVAALHNRNCKIFAPVRGYDVTFYRREQIDVDDWMEEPDHVERNHFEENAQLLHESILEAIASPTGAFSFQRFLAPTIPVTKQYPYHFQVAESTKPIPCNLLNVRCFVDDAVGANVITAHSAQAAGDSNVQIQRITVGQALDRWVRQQTGGGKASTWGPNTAKEYPAYIRTFIEIIGDKIVADITAADIQDFRDVVQALPPNVRKAQKFRDLSLRDAAATNSGANQQLQGSRTLEKKFQIFSTFLNFCVEERFLVSNPLPTLSKHASKIVQKQNRRDPSSGRQEFTHSDLKLLFESETALEIYRKQTKASRLWVLPLALYTGCRLSELSELRIYQVKQDADIHFIELLEWDERENVLKTDAAARVVPLHPILLELGFAEYVAKRKREAKDDSALFPEYQGLAHKQGNKIVSRFFNEKLLPVLGIKTKGKVFHSFRHGMINQISVAPTQDRFVSAFIGHEDKQVQEWKNRKSYGDRYGPEAVQHLLEAVGFPIDWAAYAAMLKGKGLAG